MALRQRRRPRRPFPVSDTPTQSTDPRSRVGPTRRLADAYSAVGGALLAAARSALHPRAALVAALGLDSVEKEEAAPRTELVDHGEAALPGSNLVDPYQETALLLGSILVDQDGEAALLGANLVKQDREMAPLGSNLVDLNQETAPPLGYIRVKAEGPSSDLETGRVAGTRCSEIVEEEEKDGTTAPIGSDLTGGNDRAFLERKGAQIASAPRRNGPSRSLADLIPSSPTATTSKTLPPTTSQRARKPHQPFWKKGGMCGDIFAAWPDARVPRHSAKRQHIAADAGRFPIPTSSTARGASRAAGVRHHLAAASSGSGSSQAIPPPPPSGSAGSGAAPQGAQPAASGAPPSVPPLGPAHPVVAAGPPAPNDAGSATTSLPHSAAAVGAAVAAAVPSNAPPLQITLAATQAIPPQSPPQTPPPPPGSGGSGGAVPQGAQLAAASGPPPVPPPGPAPVVAVDPPAPNDRYFNWESNHINLAVQIISSIFQVMGLGDALKAWKAGHLKAYTVFMLIAIGAVGLGMMSSTTAVGINWIRVLAANLARATSTTAVVLLLLALSEPIGYGWGIGFSTIFAIGMIVIWVLGDPLVYDTLGGWAGSIKTWCGSSWDSLKQGVNARWDSTKQNVSAGWDSIKQRVNAAPPLQQRPRAQP